MKTLILSIVVIASLSPKGWAQSTPPSYVQLTNSYSPSSGVWASNGRSWDRQYNYVLSTTNFQETYPGPIPPLRTMGTNAWATANSYPAGTEYFVYGNGTLWETGESAGLYEYGLVVAKLPTGEERIVYLARRGGENEKYFAGTSSERPAVDLIMGLEPNDWEVGDKFGYGPFPYNNAAIVWEGGGFGPGYNASMALPISNGGASGAVIASAIELDKGLDFINGRWTPAQQ